MIVKYSFQMNKNYSFEQDASAVLQIFATKLWTLIWPFDLGLTCIISLNLSNILHYLYLYGKNMIGK